MDRDISLIEAHDIAERVHDGVEQNFQNVIYISLLVLGKYVRTEVHSSQGRADCIIETSDYVYIFEFKRDGSAKDALEQIEEQG